MNSPTDSVTVVTSPAGETRPASPQTPKATAPPQYRIEEHRRTIYLTGKWDSKALGELLSLPEIPDEGAVSDSQTQRQRRTKSLNENDLIVLTDSSNQLMPKDTAGDSPRALRHGRNLGLPKSGGSSSTPTTPTVAIRGGLPRTPTRHRILFYHRHDPHYGFTNFSAHPVFYNGKRYPTSEHLFQSFKVCLVLHFRDHQLTIRSSSKNIAPILRNIFARALRGQVLPFHKHAASNPKSDLIG